MEDLKPKTRIKKHITLTADNYIFLSEAKAELLLLGTKTSYSELINLSIEAFKRLVEKENKTKINKMNAINRTLNKAKGGL